MKRNTLKPVTEATIARMGSTIWFNKVGMHDLGVSGITYVDSWGKAIESVSSIEYENLCLTLANRIGLKVREVSRDRYEEWNDVVESLRPIAVELTGKKIANIGIEEKFMTALNNQVRWDILHVLIEAEYSDIVTPEAYASNAYFYTVGHFPCGWDGTYESGKTIIY